VSCNVTNRRTSCQHNSTILPQNYSVRGQHFPAKTNIASCDHAHTGLILYATPTTASLIFLNNSWNHSVVNFSSSVITGNCFMSFEKYYPRLAFGLGQYFTTCGKQFAVMPNDYLYNMITVYTKYEQQLQKQITNVQLQELIKIGSYYWYEQEAKVAIPSLFHH